MCKIDTQFRAVKNRFAMPMKARHTRERPETGQKRSVDAKAPDISNPSSGGTIVG